MRATLASLFGLLLYVSCMVGWLLRLGPIVNNDYGIDAINLLDGAWRSYCGQVPHLDFHVGIGSLTLYAIALGMKISGVSVSAIVTAVVMVFVAVSIWSWTIAYRRMRPINAFMLALVTGSLVIGTFHLGFDYTVTTYTNIYNRFGFALLFILTIEQFFTPEDERPSDEVIGGISTGLLLVLLWLTKITFFLVAAGFIVWRALLFGCTRRWTAAFWVTAGTLFLCSGWCLAPTLRDYLVSSGLRASSISHGGLLLYLRLVMRHAPLVVALAASWALTPPFRFESRGKTVTRRTLCLTSLVVAVAGLGLMLTNFSRTYEDYTMFALIAFMPLERMFRSELRFQWRHLVMALLFVVMDDPTVAKQFSSLYFASVWKNRELAHLTLIDSPALANFFIYDQQGMGHSGYQNAINQGMELLRANGSAADKVVTLDIANPFPLALGWPGPRGVSLAYQNNYTFSLEAYPPPETLSDATFVMIPRFPSPAVPIAEIYGPYLNANFRKVAETEYWTVLKRGLQP